MASRQHFTIRRGFIAGMGFGGLGLYATWAAYGASPLPFSTGHADADVHAHGDHAAGLEAPDAGPVMADMHDGGHMSADDFMHRHAEFLQRFQDADGAVRPVAAAPVHAPAAMDMGAAHAGGAMPMPAAVTPATGRDHVTPSLPAASESEPIEVYFLAGRFSFEPDRLHLRAGQLYRFQMMASDVAHGASIAFGQASRIVRLRPDTVTTLDLTFREAGTHLVYCTVYCGPGHDGMRGLITVA